MPWATWSVEAPGCLRRGRLNGELRTDVDPELAIDLFVGPLLIRSCIRPDPDLPDGLAEQIVDTVLNGLGPEHAR